MDFVIVQLSDQKRSIHLEDFLPGPPFCAPFCLLNTWDFLCINRQRQPENQPDSYRNYQTANAIAKDNPEHNKKSTQV